MVKKPYVPQIHFCAANSTWSKTIVTDWVERRRHHLLMQLLFLIKKIYRKMTSWIKTEESPFGALDCSFAHLPCCVHPSSMTFAAAFWHRQWKYSCIFIAAKGRRLILLCWLCFVDLVRRTFRLAFSSIFNVSSLHFISFAWFMSWLLFIFLDFTYINKYVNNWPSHRCHWVSSLFFRSFIWRISESFHFLLSLSCHPSHFVHAANFNGN